MTEEQAYELIRLLMNVKGAVDYSGDASVQVIIPLNDGRKVRIGMTDSDVAAKPGLWFDLYSKEEILKCFRR